MELKQFATGFFQAESLIFLKKTGLVPDLYFLMQQVFFLCYTSHVIESDMGNLAC